MPTTLLLGNTAPVLSVKQADDTVTRTSMPEAGNQVTTVQFPDGALQAEAAGRALGTNNDPMLVLIGRSLKGDDKAYALALRDVQDLWFGAHSDDPPEWVECDDPEFARVVADYFRLWGGDPVVGRPEGWEVG